MSVLRYDVTTNDWVIYAPARAQRPQPKRPRASSEFEEQGVCPFCPGNEALTPPEVDADRDGDGRWRVRVVPNKYPAFEAGTPNQHVQEGPMFRSMGGYGVHEALIESPEHDRTLGHQPAEQVERVLRAVHRRFIEHMRDPRLRAIVVFKNHGRRAGSTLKHPHWQIMATPIAPRLQRLKHAIATEHYDRTGDNLYRRLLEEEHAAQLRVLASNPDFTAVLPYASHVARFMICTGLTMIDPVAARLLLWWSAPPTWNYQWLTFGLTDLVLIALIWMERGRPTGRTVFPVMLVVFVLAQAPSLLGLTHAPAWQEFARWFAALPLP